MSVLRTPAHGASGARIAAELREAILSGAYSPGTRIRQDDLADRYGASRLPVREALRILQAEGLITVIANTGAWVSRLTLADCEEMYRVRERVEPLLLTLSIPRLTAAAVERLDALAHRMEDAADVEEFLHLDRDFHLGSYVEADTALLGDLVLGLWNRTQHYRRAFSLIARSEGDRSIHHEHHLLVDAIRRGDTEDAERVLTGHIRRTRIELARHPEIFANAPG